MRQATDPHALAPPDLDPQDGFALALVNHLRTRARRHRAIGWGFIAAIIATVILACAAYYYVPLLAEVERQSRFQDLRDAEARIEAWTAALDTSDRLDALRERAAETMVTRIELGDRPLQSIAVTETGPTAALALGPAHFAIGVEQPFPFGDPALRGPGWGWRIIEKSVDKPEFDGVSDVSGRTFTLFQSGLISSVDFDAIRNELPIEIQELEMQSVLFVPFLTGIDERVRGLSVRGRGVVALRNGLYFSIDLRNTYQLARLIVPESSSPDTETTGGGAGAAAMEWPVMNAVAFVDDDRGFAVGQRGTVVRSRDGGVSWTIERRGSEVLHDLFLLDGATGWAVGEGGVILARETRPAGNGGAAWIARESGVSETLFAIGFRDGRRGVAVGADGVLLHSRDGGRSWRRLDSGVGDDIRDLAEVGDGWLAATDGGDVLHIDVRLFDIAAASGVSSLQRAMVGRADVAAMLAFTDAGDLDDAAAARLTVLRETQDELEAQQTLRSQLAAERARLPALRAAAAGESDSVVVQGVDLTFTITRIGIVGLLLFLVGVFSSLYRYTLRLAAFYDSRADAVLIAQFAETGLPFDRIAEIFGPQGIEFGKVRSPNDHMVEVAKAALSRAKPPV